MQVIIIIRFIILIIIHVDIIVIRYEVSQIQTAVPAWAVIA